MKDLVPEKYIELGRELAILAQKYKVNDLACQVGPGFEGNFHDTLDYRWSSGRHNKDAGEITISFSHRYHLDIRKEPQQ